MKPTNKALLLLSLLTVLTLQARANACDNPPCSDAVQAPCPEGETCVAEQAPQAAPLAPCPEGQVCDNDESKPPLVAPTPAAAPVPAEPVVLAAIPSKPPAPRLHHFGMGINVGVVDGAALDLYFRPTKWLRTSAGGTYNTIAAGFHGGLTLAPFGWGPSVTAEAGHSFRGNVNSVYGTHEPVLSALEWDYANLHGGWEFGYKRATFFVHLGESFIKSQAHNLNQQFNSSQVTFTKDPNVNAWVPSFKLGFIIYFG